MKKFIISCAFFMGISGMAIAQYLPSSGTQLTTPLTHNGNLRIGISSSATDRARCVLNFGDGDYVKMGELDADDQLSFKANKFNFNGPATVNGTTALNGAANISGILTAERFHMGYNKQFLMGPTSTNSGTPRLNISHNGVHAYVDFKDNMHFRADESWICPLSLYGNGTVGIGIGTTYTAGQYMNMGYKLAVNGGIVCEEVKVIADVPDADYVFEEDYDLQSLKDVESFIKTNKHLPNIPSAEEFKTNGYKVGEMDEMLLRKVEELTLYVIELQKQINDMKKGKE